MTICISYRACSYSLFLKLYSILSVAMNPKLSCKHLPSLLPPKLAPSLVGLLQHLFPIHNHISSKQASKLKLAIATYMYRFILLPDYISSKSNLKFLCCMAVICSSKYIVIYYYNSYP